jgi:excisionase family DNA binding protein
MLRERVELLTTAQVARRLKQSEEVVRRKARDGTLPALRLGGGPRAPLRFDSGELELWLRSNHASPVSDDGLRQEQLRAGTASPERRETSASRQSTSPAHAGPEQCEH